MSKSKIVTFSLNGSKRDAEVECFLNAQHNRSEIIKASLHNLYRKYGVVDVLEQAIELDPDSHK